MIINVNGASGTGSQFDFVDSVLIDPLLIGSTLVGMSFEWNSNTIPTGFLAEDGTAISRTTYSNLFAVIGTTFGSGDGSTTFNLPNSKGKVSIGLDRADTWFDQLGEIGGEKEHLLTIAEMPSHNHTAAAHAFSMGPHDIYTGWLVSPVHTFATDYTGGSDYHNNTQPYIVKKRIIKY